MRGLRRRLGNKYVLLGAQLLLLVPLLVSVTGGRLRFPAYRVDLDVYRLGSAALLHGDALYGTLPQTQDGQFLLFTYPPFAAIVLAPLTILPYWLACLLLTLLTLGLLAVVLSTVLGALGVLPPGLRGWRRITAVLLVAEVLEPVLRTVYAGQIDLLLLALVVLDVLVDTPKWPRGLLIGIAAAVKLTPAVFLLYFLLRRDTRALLVSAASVVVATLIGFVLAWRDSFQYWTHTVHDTGRIGTATLNTNQNIAGMLARLGLGDTARFVLWAVACVAVLGLVVWAARRVLTAAGADGSDPASNGEAAVLALICVAMFGLVVSPVSWSHHWVWVLPTVVVTAVVAFRHRNVALAAVTAVGLALMVWTPITLMPEHHETSASLWRQLAGGSYLWWALAVIVVTGAVAGAVSGRRDRTRGPARAVAPVVAAN